MNLLPPTDSDTMVVTDLGETWLPRSRQVAGLPEGGLDAGIRRDRQGSSRAFAEELYKKRLVEVGLLEEIRRPSRPWTDQDRTPIKVKGKPLSEQIMEERR